MFDMLRQTSFGEIDRISPQAAADSPGIAAKPQADGMANRFLLCQCNRILRVFDVRPRLDLDENHSRAALGDQIDLAAGHGEIAGENAVEFRAQPKPRE